MGVLLRWAGPRNMKLVFNLSVLSCRTPLSRVFCRLLYPDHYAVEPHFQVPVKNPLLFLSRAILPPATAPGYSEISPEIVHCVNDVSPTEALKRVQTSTKAAFNSFSLRSTSLRIFWLLLNPQWGAFTIAHTVMVKFPLTIPRSRSRSRLAPKSSHLNGYVNEPNMFHNYETEKITREASDAAENLHLYRVVWFFHPRLSCTMHISADVNIKCVMHDDLGWKNQTTRYKCRFSAASLASRVIFSVS